MTKDYLCVPIHAPYGRMLGMDFNFINERMFEFKAFTAHNDPFQVSFIEKERLLFEQLQIIEQKADIFVSQKLVCGMNIDFHLARIITGSMVIRQTLNRLPFIRLKISEGFPNLDDGLKNPLIRSLIEQQNRLWLNDLGAGSSNLHAVQSRIFEAVKLEPGFYRKQVNKPFFSSIIDKLRQYSELIIVEGVENAQQLQTLHANHIWGVQGYYEPSFQLKHL